MLKTKLQEDLNSALKEKQALVVSVLRLILAAIFNKEKEKRYKLRQEKDTPLTDEEVVEVISSEIKKNKEAMLLFERGKRQDLVDKTKSEIEILTKYLPEQLQEEEIKRLVLEAINKVGAKEPKDMGKVMQELMPKVKGKADAGLVSQLVKESLIQ